MSERNQTATVLRVIDLALAAVGAYGLGALLFGIVALFSRPGWGLLVATVGMLTILVVAGLFLASKERRAGPALAIVSVFLTAFVVNTGLGVWHHVTVGTYELSRWAGPDQWEVVRGLREDGDPAYPAIFPYRLAGSQDLSLFPLGGVSKVTTVHCNESGTRLVYRADRFGFNNDDAVYDAEAQGRVVVIGDSFTHGNCVEPGEDIAGQLRAIGHTAISLGMAGNGPLEELAVLREYGPGLRPSVVIWVYYEGNDLGNIRRSWQSPVLRRYVEDPNFSQDLLKRQPEIDALQKAEADRLFEAAPASSAARREKETKDYWTWMGRQLATFGRLRWLGGMTGNPSQPRFDDELVIFQRVVTMAEEAAEGAGARFVFAYLPTMSATRNPRLSERYQKDRVVAALAAEGINFIDLTAPLREYADKEGRSRTAVHLSARGYAIVARALDAELRK